MSRIPEPGWTSGRPRRAGPSSRASRPSQRLANPQLLIHIRPLSSSRISATEGGPMPGLKPSEYESNRVSTNMRSSLDRLHKRISSKSRPGNRRTISPGGGAALPIAMGRDSTTPDSKQIEGSPRLAAIITEDPDAPVEALAQGPVCPVSLQVIAKEEEMKPASSPARDVVANQSETLQTWAALQQAFRKYETSTGLPNAPAAERSNDSGVHGADASLPEEIEISSPGRNSEDSADDESISKLHINKQRGSAPSMDAAMKIRNDDGLKPFLDDVENFELEPAGSGLSGQVNTLKDNDRYSCSESDDCDSGNDHGLLSPEDCSQNRNPKKELLCEAEVSDSQLIIDDNQIQHAQADIESSFSAAVRNVEAMSEPQEQPGLVVEPTPSDLDQSQMSRSLELSYTNLALHQNPQSSDSVPADDFTDQEFNEADFPQSKVSDENRRRGSSQSLDGSDCPATIIADADHISGFVIDDSNNRDPALSHRSMSQESLLDVDVDDWPIRQLETDACAIENSIVEGPETTTIVSINGNQAFTNSAVQASSTKESIETLQSILRSGAIQTISNNSALDTVISAPLAPSVQPLPASSKMICDDELQVSDSLAFNADIAAGDESNAFAEDPRSFCEHELGKSRDSSFQPEVDNYSAVQDTTSSKGSIDHMEDEVKDKGDTEDSCPRDFQGTLPSSYSRLQASSADDIYDHGRDLIASCHVQDDPIRGCNGGDSNADFVLPSDNAWADHERCGLSRSMEPSITNSSIAQHRDAELDVEPQEEVSVNATTCPKSVSNAFPKEPGSVLDRRVPRTTAKRLFRSHSAPSNVSLCPILPPPHRQDACSENQAPDTVQANGNDELSVFNEQLSEQVHRIRNQIQNALQMSKSEKGNKSRPRAILYRRRYRPKTPTEPPDCAETADKSGENAIHDSRGGNDSKSARRSLNVPIPTTADQEIQATSDQCCRQNRCPRCPITFDSNTGSAISFSHIEIQCQADYKDIEVQGCPIESTDSAMQTNVAELAQQSVQTESVLHPGDMSTQTVLIESRGQEVQCSISTGQTETQTNNTGVDAMVQYNDSDFRKADKAIGPDLKAHQDFSDLDHHVNQFIRSISPGRSVLQERQKRQYIDLIEDSDKRVVVLDDGRPLKTTGPMGPRSLVSLNVGGQRFDVLRSTLTRYPETLLGRIANSPLPVYIDRSPTLFPLIIDTYRTGSPFVATQNQAVPFLETLRDEARFYQIEKRMFPNGIQPVCEPALHQSSANRNPVDSAASFDKGKVSEDDEGQCNQFELCERCVLVPGMSATFTPRTNETLIVDTICGKGQLLLDAEHNSRPELSVHGAVVFDSAAYLNSSEGDVFNIGTSFPYGASYTFFMFDTQHKSPDAEKPAIEEEISCDFCGLLQNIDPGSERVPICAACHSRLLDDESRAGRITPPGFKSAGKIEMREQLTVTMRIICTFDKNCRAKVSTVKKGNVAIISKAPIEAKQPVSRGRSPAKRTKNPSTSASMAEKQPLVKQLSFTSTKINKQMKPSPLPLIRRPPMV